MSRSGLTRGGDARVAPARRVGVGTGRSIERVDPGPSAGRRRAAALALAAATVIVTAAIAIPAIRLGAVQARPIAYPSNIERAIAGAAPIPGCGGTITPTLAAAEVDPCGTVDVEVVVTPPECTRCTRLNVVFVQVGRARAAEWMVRESLDALEALEAARDELEIDIRVGVVTYDTVTATVALDPTDDLVRARAALSAPTVGDAHGGYVERAARLAVGMLAEARAFAAADGLGVCDTAVLFASTSPFNIAGGLLLQNAAGIIDDADIPLTAACPEHSALNCTFTRTIVTSMRRYTEPPDEGKLGGIVREDADAFASPKTLVDYGAVLTQVLPAGLTYVEAIVEPPTSVRTVGDETMLEWRWSAPARTGAFTTTYRVAPATLGEHAIEGGARFEIPDGPDVTMEMAAVFVEVAGECAPTATPTTATPPPTTSSPTATAQRTPGISTPGTPTPGPPDTIILLPVAHRTG